MRIGIDFDNTIAGYDRAFVSLAVEQGMMSPGIANTKTEVRDFLRAQDGGEQEWQRLQGRVYGAEMGRANLMAGVDAFFVEARLNGDELFIVSHKTEFGHFDPDRINIRDAAHTWMREQGFFNPDGYGIDAGNVFFLPTREEKIAQISALKLNWFIDDLPEVLSADAFPQNVKKILFTNDQAVEPLEGVGLVKACWKDIQDELYP